MFARPARIGCVRLSAPCRCKKLYLRVVDPQQVTLLCSAKEESPEERPPPSRRRAKTARYPALLGQAAREPNSPSENITRFGLKHRLAKPRGLPCGAQLALGGPTATTANSERFCCDGFAVRVPVWRASSTARVWAKARRGADRSPLPIYSTGMCCR